MKAFLLSIGDELTSGLTVNTNSAWLSQQLTAIGITTIAHLTVGDELSVIVEAIKNVRADLLLISGGLGPTEDDLTRQALAEAMGEQLVLDPKAREELETFFLSRQKQIAESNYVQAMRPASARCISNTCGTAPGLYAKMDSMPIWVMPGVPREMKTMFTLSVLPELRKISGEEVTLTGKINTYGIGESLLGEKIQDLMVRGANPSVGTTVHDGIVSVRIYANGSHSDAEAMIERTLKTLQERLGILVFSQGDISLEEVVTRMLIERKETLATAESCTGGLLAKLLTDTPGSSASFLRGWVTYSNDAKIQELKINANAIATHGAVSEPVAVQMAEQAKKIAGGTWGIGITGIAGPEGGSAEKPVGTVWIAIAGPAGTEAVRHCFFGDRQQVRLRAAQMALARLRWKMMGSDERIWQW